MKQQSNKLRVSGKTCNMKDRSTIVTAIADVLSRSSIYRAAKGTVEVEKLYLLPRGLGEFVERMRMAGEFAFAASPPVTQYDAFYDLRIGERWQLADTDHYVRIRVVRNKENQFQDGEIKIAYPGPRSNPSARYSPAEKLCAEEVEHWQQYLSFLGFSREREYRKTRISFASERSIEGYEVELEVDEFADSPCNRILAGTSFVSLSIETEGDKRQPAEAILDELALRFSSKGFMMVACDGNYEDYFYGKPLPDLHQLAS
jgi:adenylate cyclase class IV